VQSTNCTTDWPKDPKLGLDLTGIEIMPNSVKRNWVDFKKIEKNGWATNSFGRNADRVMHVSGDADHARATKEDGNRWINNNGQGYRRSTDSIERSGSALNYKMRIDDSKMDEDGIQTNFYECDYVLKSTNGNQ